MFFYRAREATEIRPPHTFSSTLCSPALRSSYLLPSPGLRPPNPKNASTSRDRRFRAASRLSALRQNLAAKVRRFIGSNPNYKREHLGLRPRFSRSAMKCYRLLQSLSLVRPKTCTQVRVRYERARVCGKGAYPTTEGR